MLGFDVEVMVCGCGCVGGGGGGGCRVREVFTEHNSTEAHLKGFAT